MKQTILGAGGAIGTALASELTAYTDDIRLVSRQPRPVNATDELLAADLLDAAATDRAVAGSEVVYLVAGLPYQARCWEQQWPLLMQHVLQSCQRHGARLVFFDNVYMYAPAATPHLTEQSPIGPTSRKGQVRARVADALLEAAAAGKVQALIARSADFYGKGAANGVLNVLLIDPLLKGKTPSWLASADRLHSFTYVPDAARATALLGNAPDACGQVWHLPTSPERLTGRQYAALAAELLGQEPGGLRVVSPMLLRLLGLFMPTMRELVEMLYQYDHDYCFDSTKFTQRFTLTPTPYAEGLRLALGK